jgi:hypothetical protein
MNLCTETSGTVKSRYIVNLGQGQVDKGMLSYLKGDPAISTPSVQFLPCITKMPLRLYNGNQVVVSSQLLCVFEVK